MLNHTLSYDIFNVINSQHNKDIENGNYTIHEGVTSIGHDRFYICSSLTSVQLLSSLLRIVYESFGSVWSVKKVPLKQVEITVICKIEEYSLEPHCIVIFK